MATFTTMTPSGQKRGATGVVYINKEICRRTGHQEHVTSVCVATLTTVSKGQQSSDSRPISGSSAGRHEAAAAVVPVPRLFIIVRAESRPSLAGHEG